ncbi:MAG: cell division protein FtsA [Armatimonadetes bacterium]|nr:MAG: cell division protein FtsA [Armatimonadota bacterium]
MSWMVATFGSSGRNDAPGRQVAAMDIGSTKVVAAVAELEGQNRLRVVATGTAPCNGVRKGSVVDIEETAQAILAAIRSCEQMIDSKILSVVMGITGDHISGTRSTGLIPITPPGRQIQPGDVERVINHSRTMPVESDRQLLHAVPISFKVNGQAGVHDPVGMNGERLEVVSFLVTGNKSQILNLERCAERAQLRIDDIVLQIIATAEAVSTPTDRQASCAVIDIGGYSTDVGVFREGGIVSMGLVPIGAAFITSDLAYLIKTPAEEAEELKKRYGCAIASTVGEKETVPVKRIGEDKPRAMLRRVFCEIIEARAQEILELSRKVIEKSVPVEELSAGVILTGGGAKLPGMDALAARVFGGVPIRVAGPMPLAGLGDVISDLEHSSIVGLLHHARRLASKRVQKPEQRGFLGKLKDLFGDAGEEEIS